MNPRRTRLLSTGASPDGQDLVLLRYGLGGTLASEWFGDGGRFEADLPSTLTLEPTTNLPHIGYRTIAEDSAQSYFVRRFDNRGLPILGSVQAISGGGNRSLLATSNSPRSAVAYGSFLSGTGNPLAGAQTYDGSLNLGPRTTIGLRGMPNLTLHNVAPYSGGAFGIGVGDNGASATFDGALVRFGTPGTLGASIAPNTPYVAAKGTLFTDCPSGVVSEVVDRAPVGYTTVYKDGSFRFSPPRDFHGKTSFTYRLNTSRYMSGIRTFEITVQ
ncbi:hypothetical protein EON81_07520 [bacterium]|nr:MAG: hypothetical protein EON81_07520 [bacterium]